MWKVSIKAIGGHELNCGWCGDSGDLIGPANRCKRCGGAHWTCGTSSCKRQLLPDDRCFCPMCGAARPESPVPNGALKPVVTCLRTELPVAQASVVNTQDGFMLRSAEGLTAGGRMVLAGVNDVFLFPAHHGGLGDASPQMAHVYGGRPERRALNMPVELDSGLLLFGDEQGLFTLSVQTGNMKRIGRAGKSLISPLVGAVRDKMRDVWAVQMVPDQAGAVLLHLRYRCGKCVEGGQFDEISRSPISATVLAAFEAFRDDSALRSGQSARLYIIEESRTQSLVYVEVDQSTGKVQAASHSISRPVFPTALTGRMRLWSTVDGLFWLSRGGQANLDGALAVEPQVRGSQREIELNITPEGQVTVALLPLPPVNEVQRKMVDGTWVRIGGKNGVRLAWGAVEESARMMVKPVPEGWNEDWLMSEINARPMHQKVGPLVPTRWGFASSLITDRPQPGITVIYVDFPADGPANSF